MVESSVSETTQLLRDWAKGNRQALEVLIPKVYRKLRRLAGHCLRNERPDQSIQVSDLVHEANLHLADLSQLDWQHCNHFLAVSARLMRTILVDRARKRLAAKRGEKVKETAGIVGVSAETVMRDWTLAKACLLKELTAV